MKKNRSTAFGFAVGVAITSLCFVIFQLLSASVPKRSELLPPPTDPNNPCSGYHYEKLPPPKFSSAAPAKFVTNKVMEVRVAWSGVNGAKGYDVYVEDKTGRLVRKYETKRTLIYLRDIPMPQEVSEIEYQIRLATVNGADEPGDKGEARDLKVSRQASVMAPTLKKIEVED